MEIYHFSVFVYHPSHLLYISVFFFLLHFPIPLQCLSNSGEAIGSNYELDISQKYLMEMLNRVLVLDCSRMRIWPLHPAHRPYYLSTWEGWYQAWTDFSTQCTSYLILTTTLTNHFPTQWLEGANYVRGTATIFFFRKAQIQGPCR